MFLSNQHEQVFNELEETFNPNGYKQQKVLNLIFSLPPIFAAFKEALIEYTPIEVAIKHLDDANARLARNYLSTGEENLLKLAVELYNGTESLEKGTFKLYDALNSWDDTFTSLFYSILQIIRPTASNQQ